jgi:hypothetical protein
MSMHTSLKIASLGLAALTFVACQDSATTSLTGASHSPSLSTTTTVGDTTVTTFRVDPTDNRMIVIVGTHKLDIPPGSICDPATAGYGPTLWDAPCAPATSGVTFTAKTWSDAGGRPRIEIAPDVRFVPGKVVTMYLKDPQAALDSTATIGWCATGSATCVNEAKADPSLAPTRDGVNGLISRRVKHFSGYTIIVGFDDGSFSLDRAATTGTADRASGYMTTTGRSGYITTTGRSGARPARRHEQR